MAKNQSSIVLIFGQDSLRADRALDAALKARNADPSEVVRIWGDESSFNDVFAAVTSRSLFSDQTVVVVRRAERLRGAGSREAADDDIDRDDSSDEPSTPEPEEVKPARKGAKSAAPASDLPEIDPGSCLILLARKADRRIGLWKKISKVAEVIDVDYLKGRYLLSAAEAEAKAMGLRVSGEVLRETVEQSGPALGRIVSEFEKMLLFNGGANARSEDILAVTSSPPLYRLSDALTLKNKREILSLLDEALRQGEAGLRVLATAHGTIRKLAMFRALRKAGVPSADAGTQCGILPFKVADTDRAARSWSDGEIAKALSVFAEADRRLKLSAPAVPVLTHALTSAASGGRA